MRLVALYKTWDGGEFVDASLASVYDSVDAIVMVHSDLSWLGERGNTVEHLARDWCLEHDAAKKVHHLNVSTISQEQQYAAGVEFIERTWPGSVVMVVDADEVWETKYIENAKQQIAETPHVPAYRINMHTYLKSPFYRVMNPYGSPTAFLREPRLLTQSPRACRAPARQLRNVWMHHYTAVRSSREQVERKIRQSCLADGGETVVPNWMEEVYDKLPEGRNLHYFERHRVVWNRVEKVTVAELPPAMLKAKLLPQFYATAPQRVGKELDQHGEFMRDAERILDVVARHAHVFDSGESSRDFYDLPKRIESEEFRLLRDRVRLDDDTIEIGCYTGLNLMGLNRTGHVGRLTGLDFVQGAVDWLREHWEGHPDALRTICCEFPGSFPVGPIYDTAICFDVLEHQRNVGQFLDGVASVLKPGGKALFLVPARKEYYDCGHVAFYPDEECLSNALNYSFQVEECFELASCNKIFAQCRRRPE